MTITQVNSSTFLADTVMLIRDMLLANITDPLAAASQRPSSQKFVVTSYADRGTSYPLVTVVDRGITGFRKGGKSSNAALQRLGIEIRTWGRNVKERDEISQSIFDYLRSTQQANSTDKQLHDYSTDVFENVDEPGYAGIKSKIHKISFLEVLM